MPQDLPGFYYDEEKNRYFPIKGPIPGSSNRKRPSTSATCHQEANKQKTTSKAKNVQNGVETGTCKLIQDRELYGKVITSNRKRHNFQAEFRDRHASEPVVWKYRKTVRTCSNALDLMQVDKHTSTGQVGTNVLLAGCSNTLSLLEVEQVGQTTDQGEMCLPDCTWSLKSEIFTENRGVPGPICRPFCSTMAFESDITSVKTLGKNPQSSDDGFSTRRALITTLGSEASRGSVYVMNLAGALDFTYSDLTFRMHKVASIRNTIWNSDCSYNGRQAVIGTNHGAVLVNLESGVSSWVCRTKSDVFSQQFDQSGNIVLCGLRNGTILTVDIRQKREGSSERLTTNRISFPSSNREPRKSTRKWFECKGNVDTSHTIFMPSSVSSLVSLQSYDQYFLASSMDGSIKLYDHRMTQRGPVQSYEGHVNSHTRIQLGIDPSETFIMAGGEDGYLRIWNIKTGRLLFGDKFMNSTPATVCWPRTSNNIYGNTNSWDAWLGSEEGLFLIHWQ